MAGVHGNRTHPTRRGQVANGFEDRESHQAPSTPPAYTSTRPYFCFATISPTSTPSGTRERYSAARFAGTATRRPPDVCGSTSNARNLAEIPPQSTFDSRYVSLRSAPPVRIPASHASSAPGKLGTRFGSMTSVTPLARAMCDEWPSKLNPVTSVAHRTPTWTAAWLAFALSLHIDAYNASASAVPSMSRFPAVARMPVPSGFVRISRSPGCAFALLNTRCGCTRPVTDNPNLSSSSMML